MLGFEYPCSERVGIVLRLDWNGGLRDRWTGIELGHDIVHGTTRYPHARLQCLLMDVKALE